VVSRSRGRLAPRRRGLLLALLAVLAVLVYRESVPAWVWTLVAGIVVVTVVYYWLGVLRGRRR
jgi:O-antigen/teichoic acid export membrane protein